MGDGAARDAQTARKPASLCGALADRVDSCWHRLDDVVDELASVHGVSTAEIIARVVAVAPVGDALGDVLSPS